MRQEEILSKVDVRVVKCIHHAVERQGGLMKANMVLVMHPCFRNRLQDVRLSQIVKEYPGMFKWQTCQFSKVDWIVSVPQANPGLNRKSGDRTDCELDAVDETLLPEWYRCQLNPGKKVLDNSIKELLDSVHQATIKYYRRWKDEIEPSRNSEGAEQTANQENEQDVSMGCGSGRGSNIPILRLLKYKQLKRRLDNYALLHPRRDFMHLGEKENYSFMWWRYTLQHVIGLLQSRGYDVGCGGQQLKDFFAKAQPADKRHRPEASAGDGHKDFKQLERVTQVLWFSVADAPPDTPVDGSDSTVLFRSGECSWEETGGFAVQDAENEVRLKERMQFLVDRDLVRRIPNFESEKAETSTETGGDDGGNAAEESTATPKADLSGQATDVDSFVSTVRSRETRLTYIGLDPLVLDLKRGRSLFTLCKLFFSERYHFSEDKTKQLTARFKEEVDVKELIQSMAATALQRKADKESAGAAEKGACEKLDKEKLPTDNPPLVKRIRQYREHPGEYGSAVPDLRILHMDKHFAAVMKPPEFTTEEVQFDLHVMLDRSHSRTNADTSRTDDDEVDLDVYSVSRLDRMTSGVLISAIGRRGFDNLKAKFTNRTIDKYYVCLVEGRLDGENHAHGSADGLKLSDAGVAVDCFRSDESCRALIESCIAENWWSEVNTRLLVDPKDQKRMYCSYKGKESITKYRALGYFESVTKMHTLVLCKPVTGRMHQIRIHMMSRGHPLAGDHKYGNHKPGAAPESRLFLHCCMLRFTDDIEGVDKSDSHREVELVSTLSEDLVDQIRHL